MQLVARAVARPLPRADPRRGRPRGRRHDRGQADRRRRLRVRARHDGGVAAVRLSHVGSGARDAGDGAGPQGRATDGDRRSIRTIALTFLIGSALAGAAGNFISLGAYYGTTWFLNGVLRRAQGVHRRGAGRDRQLGGRDARRTSSIGLIESFTTQFISDQWSNVVVFAVLDPRADRAPPRALGRIAPGQGMIRRSWPFAVVVAIALVPLVDRNAAHIDFLVDAGAFMLLALGLNIVVGFAGLLDLGYAAFFAIGSYAYAMLASPQFGVHVPFWVMLFLGAAIAGVFGLVLGAPTLRLRGDYLAIVTLGFGGDRAADVPQLDALYERPERDRLRSTGRSCSATAFGFDPLPYFYLTCALIVVAIVLSTQRPRQPDRPRVRSRYARTNWQHAAWGSTRRAPSSPPSPWAASFSAASPACCTPLSCNWCTSPDQFQFKREHPRPVDARAWRDWQRRGRRRRRVHPRVRRAGRAAAGDVDRAAAIGLHVDLTNYRFMLYGGILVLMMLLRPSGLIPSGRRRDELRGAAEDPRLLEREDAEYAEAPHADRAAGGGTVALERRRQTVRRGHRAERSLVRDRRGRASRADRTERRRKVDAVQPDHRTLSTGRRRDRVRATVARGLRPRSRRGAWRRAHLSEHPPVRVHDRARERAGRRTRAPARDAARRSVAHASPSRRGAHRARARCARAAALRRARTQRADAYARNLPYWVCAPARDRQGARRATAPAAARRTRCRDHRAREGGAAPASSSGFAPAASP